MAPRINDPSFLIQSGRTMTAQDAKPKAFGSKPKPKAVRALDHLSFVRTLPCCSCGHDPAGTAHHLLRGVVRGTGMKAEDRWAIPLCGDCHDPNSQGSVHHDGNETRWLKAKKVPGLFIASALWALRDCCEPERTMAGGEIASIKETSK